MTNLARNTSALGRALFTVFTHTVQWGLALSAAGLTAYLAHVAGGSEAVAVATGFAALLAALYGFYGRGGASSAALNSGVWLQTATVGMDPDLKNEILDNHGDYFLDNYWEMEDRYDSNPLHIGSSAWHAYGED